jgi:leader peptidase (prepilin peptidase)/N-methyltransferase
MALLAFWYVYVFLVGLCVGSFLNVVVARLPYEKSLLWPSSRCMACLQPIRWHDNLPLVGYLVLGGRCRSCHRRYSARYVLIELATGVVFVGLFHLEVIANVLELPMLRRNWGFALGLFPLESLLVFVPHAILVSFLIAASLCDLTEMEIPLSITLWGTIIGLAVATALPWPSPEPAHFLPAPGPAAVPPTRGTYAWPVWYPLPTWLPPGSWRLGLATGLAGAAAGMVLLRLVRFLFWYGRGIEGLGVGDADLMMMAGAFVGWQPVVVAFLVAVFPGLFFALAQMALRGEQSLPFGPSLSLGVVITLLCWPAIGAALGPLMFDPVFVIGVGVAAAVAFLAVSFLLRVI